MRKRTLDLGPTGSAEPLAAKTGRTELLAARTGRAELRAASIGRTGVLAATVGRTGVLTATVGRAARPAFRPIGRAARFVATGGRAARWTATVGRTVVLTAVVGWAALPAPAMAQQPASGARPIPSEAMPDGRRGRPAADDTTLAAQRTGPAAIDGRGAAFGAPSAAADTPTAGSRVRPTAPAPLTLSDAVRLALARHPTLAAADAAVDRAASAVREAEAARLPSLSTEASLTRFQEPMVVAPLHGFDPRQPPTFDNTLGQGSVTLGYMLFDGGARGARIERAEALTDAAVAERDGARQALIARTAGAYLRVRTAREVVRANERRVEALERERDRAAQYLERGRGARVMVLRAEAALSTARAEATRARAELAVAERELARLLGLEPERITSSDVAGMHPVDAAVPPREALLERALAASPELARAERRVAAAEATRAEAKSLWLPKVQAVGRYVEYAAGTGREAGEWQGGVQLSFPLFTGGARSAAGQRADAEIRGAKAGRELARLELEAALDRALSTLESERARVEALRAAVAQSEEVARIERLALEAGAGVQSDYLAAEAELLRARAALSAAEAAEVAARIELARLTGRLTPEWLETNLETGS